MEGVGPDRYMTASGQGVDDFGTVQFRYTSYMPIQPVLRYFSTRGWVDHFSTVFGPFRYIMKSDCKMALNGICVTDSSMFDRYT